MATFVDSHFPPPKGWKEFEAIVKTAAAIRWKHLTFVGHGRAGQRQDGIDIYGQGTNGELIGLQCKNSINGLTKDVITAEITKAEQFTPPITLLAFATTANRDVSLQKYARDLNSRRSRAGRFVVELLFWEDICHDLSSDDACIFKHFPQYKYSRARPHTANKRDAKWAWTFVSGSTLRLLNGSAGTQKQPNGFPRSIFPCASTVVLGCSNTADMDAITETIATWDIPLPAKLRSSFKRGYLIVASIRHFAGLHTKFYDAKAELQVNNTFIDHIRLRHKPPQHSHYFHSLPIPDFPRPRELLPCQNLYSWPLLEEALVESDKQTVQIAIGNQARWDIDYVGILILP